MFQIDTDSVNLNQLSCEKIVDSIRHQNNKKNKNCFGRLTIKRNQ